GVESFPTWEHFLLLKSKLSQKRFLQENGLPTAAFLPVSSWGPEAEDFLKKGAVLKAGKGGYDGKGVWKVDAKGMTSEGPAREIAARLVEPYLEEMVSFDEEAAVV